MTAVQTTEEVTYRFDPPYPSQLEGIELRVGDTLLIIDRPREDTFKVLTMGALGTMGAFPSSGNNLWFYVKFVDLCEDEGITLKKSLPKPVFPSGKGKRILEITKFDETGLFVKVVG